jgi:hypothetical protein
MILTPPPKPARRSETRDLVQPIIRALNRLSGVRVARNANLGPVVPWGKRMRDDVRPIIAGLGSGSADIVGIEMVTITPEMVGRTVGIAFALEVKLPPGVAPDGHTLRGGTLEKDQERWLRIFRKFGGFAAVVRSIEEATYAVRRCREGASE